MRRVRPPRRRGFAILPLAFLVLLLPGPLLAPDPSKAVTQYAADSWGEGAGLPFQGVEALEQTPDGYLWAGTSEGLARFDGERFTVFTPGNAEGLASGYVTALLVDGAGALWVGTANGLSRYKDGVFTKYTTAGGLGHDVVLCLEAAGDGTLWVGTNGGGLSSFKDGRFRTWTARDGLLSDVVFSLAWEGDGTLWIGTTAGVNRLVRGGLSVYSREEQLLRSPPFPRRKAGSPVYISSKGHVTIAGEASAGPLATLQDVSFCLDDKDGNLWIATGHEGAYRLTAGSSARFHPDLPSGDFAVNSLLEDREGSLWIASDSGLWRLKDPQAVPFGAPEGLTVEGLYSVCAGPSGDVWFGGMGGFGKYSGGAFTCFPSKDRLSNETVVSILQDSRGDVWLGTRAGLDLLRDGKITREALGEKHARLFVISLCEDARGRIWAGTRGRGLYGIQGREVRRYTSAEGLTDNLIGAVCASRDGSLWVGGTAGLNRLDPETGLVRCITTKGGLVANYVLALYEDARGILWAGCWGGLARVEGEHVTAITPRQGLPSDVIYQILEDGDGRLWMSSPQGIFSVLKSELDELAGGSRQRAECRLFTEHEGMRARRCTGTTQPAGGRTPGGQLWFPTGAGLVLVEPGKMRALQDTPAVVIESVTVDGKAYSAAEPVVAPPGRRRLEVTFSAPSFRNPSKVLCRYRLEGFDPGWTEADTRRSAYYTNLPKGHFVFRVKACNEDGVWNPVGTAVDVTLRPYVYETWWFGLLSVASAVLLVGGLVHWRFRRLEARRRELEVLVAERTSQLAEANRELERLANEDGLTRIPNIRHFYACLDGEWRRAIRNVKPLSIVLIDVDHFKKYNDRYGHQAGDECLRRVAGVLKGRMKRVGDVVARYGGEEFIVLLANADAEGAALVAWDLRRGVEDLGIPHEDSDAAQVVTISMGCATTVPKEGEDPGELIAAADRALYDSKHGGRNRSTSVDLSENSEFGIRNSELKKKR